VNNALTDNDSLTGAEQKWLCGQSRSSKKSQSPSVRERSQRDPKITFGGIDGKSYLNSTPYT
jgi:hypothetical protein